MLAKDGETKTPIGEAGLPLTLRMKITNCHCLEKMYSNKGAHLSEQNTRELGRRVETEPHLLSATGALVAHVGTKGDKQRQ